MTRFAFPLTPGQGQSADTDLTSDSVPVQAIGIRRSDDNKELATVTTDGMLVNLGANNDVTVTSGTIDLGATDNAVLDAIAASVDGVEALLGTIDADTGSIATSAATIAAAVSTEMQVDVVGSLPAGTNAIGKLAANSGVDIGDVGILSIAAGTNVIGKVDHPTTGIGDGRAVTVAAGTRVALASSTTAKWVTVTAETDNSGLVVVGGSTVVAALATRRGVPLYAGDVYGPIPIDNLADVWIDTTVSGDGVTYAYGTGS